MNLSFSFGTPADNGEGGKNDPTPIPEQPEGHYLQHRDSAGRIPYRDCDINFLM